MARTTAVVSGYTHPGEHATGNLLLMCFLPALSQELKPLTPPNCFVQMGGMQPGEWQQYHRKHEREGRVTQLLK